MTQNDVPKRTHYAMIPLCASMELSPHELALYVNYMQTCGRNNGVCTKSNQTLADETGMSARHIQRMRKSLAEKGYIQVLSTGNESPPRVKMLESVWQKNDEYVKSTLDSQSNPVTDSPNSANIVETHSPPPLDSQSNKQEVSNNKDNTLSPADDEPKKEAQKDSSMVYDWIAENVFNIDPLEIKNIANKKLKKSVGGRIAKIKQVVEGIHAEQKKPLTTAYLDKFWGWIKQEKQYDDLKSDTKWSELYLEWYLMRKAAQQKIKQVAEQPTPTPSRAFDPPPLPTPVRGAAHG